ncbi:CGCGG family rSAM-modified RiPP protein [Alicyclobacillus sp.]|uniref:CGCGG family putative rSAM-modified RiPP protein n=1 Tax=Alicyclobacillus sp. TaxID=61169 RepID=UPI0025C2ACB6|nr:CGCGG family rSAM-modified RiPP protein [Alicyclobacillus sp.]
MKRWSINLETEEYVADKNLIIQDAIGAIRETAVGGYVNLAVAPDHGNPDAYLVPALLERFGDAVQIRFVDQCGCGGYVYRVDVLRSPSPAA